MVCFITLLSAIIYCLLIKIEKHENIKYKKHNFQPKEKKQKKWRFSRGVFIFSF